ncbi:MAG TPA: translocation/assembly module TamB domain-containing protein [Terracidiphilus sp.]|nr:translocation/assembly module TamB domain-containing protein [Terracidiphilus sp.]
MSAYDTESKREESEGRNRRKGGRSWIRVVSWLAASGLVLVLAAGLAIVALVNTDGVHRYLIGLAERKSSAALGIPVHLENFALHLPTLSVDLYGIRLSGASPYSNPPLLQADHVRVGIRIVSVLRRAWYLDRLQIDHPVAWVVVGKNGRSNLPGFKSGGSSHIDAFELGIRHAVLDHGEVYYNDRPSSLEADLHNLEFRASFSSLRTLYTGSLTYTDGRLEYGSFRPFQHDFGAKFRATPGTFQMTRAQITSGHSEVILSAVLHNYSEPVIQAKYDAVVDDRQLARLLDEPSIPAGLIRTTGSVEYQQLPNRTLIQGLVVDGNLACGELAIRTSAVRTEVRNLAAHYSLANGDARLLDLRAEVLGGDLTAQGATQSIEGDSHSSYRGELRGVSLSQVRSATGRSVWARQIALTGMADGKATATWGRTIHDLVVQADANVNGRAQRVQPASAQIVSAGISNPGTGKGTAAVIPIDGALRATYKNAEHELKFDNSYLRSSQTDVDLNGAVGKHSSLSVRLQSNDLREIATIVDVFRPTGTAQIDLAGRASFQGVMQGSTVSPSLSGQLSAANLHFNGTDWKTLRTGIQLSPSHAALQNILLESGENGRITGSASAGLQKWTVRKRSAIQVDLIASQIDIGTIAKLSRNQIPVSGRLAAQIKLHGNMMNPEGSGNVHLTGVTAYGQDISSARLGFTGSANQAQTKVSIRLPAGTIESRVVVEPQQRTFTAQLSSNGIDLAKLQALKVRDIDAKGLVAIEAHGQGTFDNPEVNADLQIPAVAIGGQTFSGIKLQMNVANHVANAELTSSVANTSLRAKAKVDLSGDYLADASLDTQALPLQPLLAVYAPEEAANVNGQAEIHAVLHGPLKQKSRLEAQLTIPVFKIGYGNSIQLSATSPIRVGYRNSVFDIQPAMFRGTDTNLQLQGSIPVHGGAPMSLKAQGTVNLQLAQVFEPDLRTSGQLKLNIDSHGVVGSGQLGGEIDLVDANLASINSPVGLQHGNGVLKLTTDRLEITKFDGTIGGGPVTAQGAITYRPKIQFDLVASAQGVRALYPEGVRESVDAKLRLTGSTTHAVLGGSVHLTDLSFTPAFDLDTVVNKFSGEVTSPVEPGFEQNLRLNIAVSSTNNVDLVSRTLSVAGSANLQVRGSAADPVILGRVNLSGGDAILHGDRFVLTGGTVQFINPGATQPVLNVALTTTIQEYKIHLRFNGPMDQLRTQYTSDPALPAADIINLLAFGQTTEASGMNATPANQQAESLVASQVAGQVTSRISKAAGISQLSISPVLAGSTSAGPPGANITIQQRVTGNLFVTFSTNVATTQGQTIQGQYQISPRVAVSATRDPNGGFAIDTLIKKSW